MPVINELKTGKYRDSKNNIVQNILSILASYEYIERDSLAVSDDFLREIVDKNYLKIDLDGDGNTIIFLDKPTQLFSDANTLFLNSTNGYMDDKYSSRYGNIRFSSNLLYFFGEYGELIFRTSLLTSYEIKDDIVKFNTLNSIYEFKILKELPTVELASEDEIEKVMKFEYAYLDVLKWKIMR